MKQAEVNRENLIKLIENLRKEDKKELKYEFGNNFKDKFIKITLNSGEKYFFADEFKNPLAIGGVEKTTVDNLKIGQVWLISSKYFSFRNLELIKFIKSKIEDYQNDYDILFNKIYKSNYNALKWLTKCGFKVLDISLNNDYKLFYFTKGGINFDLRYITR